VNGVAESRFLNGLPVDLLDRMRGGLATVLLTKGEVLVRTGSEIDYVYYPTSCLVSIVFALRAGHMLVVESIGTDGFVGLPAFLSKNQVAGTTSRVQISGEALRMSAQVFYTHVEDSRLRRYISKYAARTLTTLAQSAACAAFHPVHERLARWLLIARDGIQSDEIGLTHDNIALMLGVHRPTVTNAIHALESAGLIKQSRGSILIVDGNRLVEAACECYR
jgi:CRP-like cAMP-binding protein